MKMLEYVHNIVISHKLTLGNTGLCALFEKVKQSAAQSTPNVQKHNYNL